MDVDPGDAVHAALDFAKSMLRFRPPRPCNRRDELLMRAHNERTVAIMQCALDGVETPQTIIRRAVVHCDSYIAAARGGHDHFWARLNRTALDNVQEQPHIQQVSSAVDTAIPPDEVHTYAAGPALATRNTSSFMTKLSVSGAGMGVVGAIASQVEAIQQVYKTVSTFCTDNNISLNALVTVMDPAAVIRMILMITFGVFAILPLWRVTKHIVKDVAPVCDHASSAHQKATIITGLIVCIMLYVLLPVVMTTAVIGIADAKSVMPVTIDPVRFAVDTTPAAAKKLEGVLSLALKSCDTWTRNVVKVSVSGLAYQETSVQVAEYLESYGCSWLTKGATFTYEQAARYLKGSSSVSHITQETWERHQDPAFIDWQLPLVVAVAAITPAVVLYMVAKDVRQHLYSHIAKIDFTENVPDGHIMENIDPTDSMVVINLFGKRPPLLKAISMMTIVYSGCSTLIRVVAGAGMAYEAAMWVKSGVLCNLGWLPECTAAANDAAKAGMTTGVIGTWKLTDLGVAWIQRQIQLCAHPGTKRYMATMGCVMVYWAACRVAAYRKGVSHWTKVRDITLVACMAMMHTYLRDVYELHGDMAAQYQDGLATVIREQILQNRVY